MTIAFVGLGSNLDRPVEQVQGALRELDAVPHTRVVKSSSLYRSGPVGYADQPEFINAVAQLETGLSADRLLSEVKEIEKRHGRLRPFANAPRTLDIDLLLFGNATLQTENLKIPHPRMHERAFVLKPLVEIAGDTAIPGRGKAADLLKSCESQPVERIAGK